MYRISDFKMCDLRLILMVLMFLTFKIGVLFAKETDDLQRFELTTLFTQAEIKKYRSVFLLFVQMKQMKQSYEKDPKAFDEKSFSEKEHRKLEDQVKSLEKWVVDYLKKPIEQQKDFAIAKRMWGFIVHEDHSLLIFKHDFWCVHPILIDILLSSKKILAQKKLDFELKKRLCTHTKR
jgi:hypothetical protein